ncbi:MAG: hypothetical protein EAY81_02205 [Bacteroidetes bacterium]|nr:MAG: hypothetical protein EAY81_02205 [Bacteroidota bacterium]
MKKYLYNLLLIIICNGVNGQVVKENLEKLRKLPEKISDNYLDDTTSKPNYLLYPTIAYTPETKWEFGLVNVVLFYAKNDKRNRLSEINSFTFYTQQRQYGIWLDHAIYGNKDKYFFLGKVRFQYFPLKYYGIGNQAPKDNPEVINSFSLQIRERVLKQIRKHLFVGIEFDYQNLYQVEFKNTNPKIALPLGYRNERKAVFAELAYLNYGKVLPSDFSFQSFQFEGRYFRKGFTKDQVAAFQVLGQFNSGNMPFNQLALMGGEMMMRGYYLGRFRDKNYLAAQAEYRFLPFPFSKRLGGALFAAIGSVEPKVKDFSLYDIKPSGGFGLKYLVFKSKDIYLRGDIAFTREGRGFYLFIGEAF